MVMQIIDTHAHLYSNKFEGELGALMENAKNNSVTKILLPNIDISTIDSLHKLSVDYPDICFPMMGIHPCNVTNEWEKDWAKMELLFGQNNYIAVGEIGLDLYWDKSNLDIQKAAFKKQSRFAHAHNLPIAIHARESLDEILSVLYELNLNGLEGVFHCFSGTKKQAQQISELGFYLGVGGVYTFKKTNELREAIKSVGIDKLVLETDSPYLSPEPKRGKRNEPSFTLYIAERVAKEFNLTLEEVAEITTMNAYKLFKLK